MRCKPGGKAWSRKRRMNSSTSRVITLELDASLVSIIFPLEGDAAVFQGQQALVGNGDAMSIAAEIFQHLLRTAKRRLGVDHPFRLFQRRQMPGGNLDVLKRFQIAEELKLDLIESFLKAFQKQRL